MSADLSALASLDDAQLAAAIVTRAAHLASDMRADGLVTEFKTSISDVVTAADRASEKFVVKALAELRPNDGILGEEGSAKEGTSGRTWVIDPVDGTYNFTTASDYWCSALALVEGTADQPQKLILGAVHRPASNETWVGGPDLTTTRTEEQTHVQPLSIDDIALSKTCVGTYLHSKVVASVDPEDTRDTRNWLMAASKSATWRMLGSASVDLAGVADGRLGAWFQRDVAPWDWLPGKALVEGAGGITAEVGRWKIAGTPSAVRELADILK